MAPIVLTTVTKTYSDREAVRDVSFTVPDGAICALVGPAGSGKSTLLRLIANREAPTAGLIEVGDSASQSWRVGRTDVVRLIDASELSPRAHVYANMADGLADFGLKRTEVEANVLRAADALGLGPLMARKVGSLSSGETALASFGRALAHQPRAILLDEPFAAVDPARRIALRRELRALAKAGTTVVITTQSVEDALALGDVVAVLDAGRLVAAGPRDEIYDRPATAELARLFGAPPMNIFPVRGNQTGLSLEDGTHFGAASVMTTATFAQLGIRPEHLFVVGDGAPPAAATLPVTVEAIERLGHESLIHARVGAHPVTARVAGAVETPAGGPLKLGARQENLHMFDAETGARI